MSKERFLVSPGKDNPQWRVIECDTAPAMPLDGSLLFMGTPILEGSKAAFIKIAAGQWGAVFSQDSLKTMQTHMTLDEFWAKYDRGDDDNPS